MDVLSWSRHHRLFPGEGSFDLGGFLAPRARHRLRRAAARWRSSTTPSGRPTPSGPRGTPTARCAGSPTRPRGGPRAAAARVRSGCPVPRPRRRPGSTSWRSGPPTPSRVRGAARPARLHLPRPPPQQGGDPVDRRARPGWSSTSSGRRTSAAPGRGGLPGRRPRAASLRRGVRLGAARLPADPRGEEELRGRRRARRHRGLPRPARRTATAGSPSSSAARRRPSRLVTSVDHVNLAQPWQHYDEAMLFYSSVARPVDPASTEVAGPRGLVRSQVMRTDDGVVRIPLNVVRRCWMPPVCPARRVRLSRRHRARPAGP